VFDEGHIRDLNGDCVLDTTCDATLTQCVDFDKCMNTGGLAVTGRETCTGNTNDGTLVCVPCTEGVDCANPNEDGDGIVLECADPNAFPANDGNANSDMTISCVCDGKTECEWQSDDWSGPIEEDCMCLTDTKCPVTPFREFEGEMKIDRNRFINDPTHNTLQADLFDGSKAEVLGRIETSVIGTAMANYDWSEGHFLVVIWTDPNPDHVIVTPYGDYMDSVISNNEGDASVVQVWETFTDSLVLRDGSPRDLTQNLEVVLDIKHDYDMDSLSHGDVYDLLEFRAALIPKTWTDAYGDTTKKTAQEIADCIDDMVDSKAKVDGDLRKKNSGGKKKWKKPKKPKDEQPLSWKQKQQRRRERLAQEKKSQ
jgi:hypothetical protein